jgi:hypothetical protein
MELPTTLKCSIEAGKLWSCLSEMIVNNKADKYDDEEKIQKNVNYTTLCTIKEHVKSFSLHGIDVLCE